MLFSLTIFPLAVLDEPAEFLVGLFIGIFDLRWSRYPYPEMASVFFHFYHIYVTFHTSTMANLHKLPIFFFEIYTLSGCCSHTINSNTKLTEKVETVNPHIIDGWHHVLLNFKGVPYM